MIKALCTAEFDDAVGERIGERVAFDRVGFSLDMKAESRMTTEQIQEALAGYDVFFCGYEKTTRAVMEANPELALILSVRDGPEENIDVEAATELGLPVIACGGRCERSVPEFLVTQMLLMAKPTVKVTNLVRNEGWTAANNDRVRAICEASHELAGSTVGIIGFGRNGRGVAQRLSGFGVELLAYDPYLPEEVAQAAGATLVSLEELCERSDYVVMMARVTPETRGMMTRELFAHMKDGACFVNSARASLVDNDALLDELRSGRLRAAIDVFDREPLGEDSPWLEIDADRLLLTTHLAGLSLERITYQSEKLERRFFDFLAGTLAQEEIYNPAVLASPAFAARGGRLYGAYDR